eukprot:923691-Pyramimonas_sp.AAC.1
MRRGTSDVPFISPSSVSRYSLLDLGAPLQQPRACAVPYELMQIERVRASRISAIAPLGTLRRAPGLHSTQPDALPPPSRGRGPLWVPRRLPGVFRGV